MGEAEVCDWIALSLLPGLGPVLTAQALAYWKDPARVAYRVPAEELRRLRGFRATVEEVREARRDLRHRAERTRRRCKKLEIRLLVHGAPDYPASLVELPDPPILLYSRGVVPEGLVRVALVGSRRATSYGLGRARTLAEELAARGVEIVSGGARGIDTQAHCTALDVGGRTIAVLGSGFEHPYPRENRRLFDRIADHGAVLSEFALDQTPAPKNFPRRNRLISGLSAAVVVVEARARSGSLITASHAADQGREVLALAGPVTSDSSEGCHRLIQQGAKLVHSTQDILDEIPPMYAASLVGRPPEGSKGPRAAVLPAGATADEAELFEMLGRSETMQLDELADRAPFGIARVQMALLGLQVQGAIETLPGRHYRRRDR